MFILFYFLESACWRCHLLTTNICGNSQGELKIFTTIRQQILFVVSSGVFPLEQNREIVVQKCSKMFLNMFVRLISRKIFVQICFPQYIESITRSSLPSVCLRGPQTSQQCYYDDAWCQYYDAVWCRSRSCFQKQSENLNIWYCY